MTYKMFIDDERDPVVVYGEFGRDMLVARTAIEAQQLIFWHGIPDFIGFDHDLGDGPSAFDFLKWLIETDLDHDVIVTPFRVNVHSANPVGSKNIQGMIDGYFDHKFKRNK